VATADETETDNGEESEDDDDDAESDTPAAPPPAAPVTILVRTAMGVGLLDQRVELQNVQGHRTVASLKESVRRQLPGKPPVALLQLIHEGVILADDELVTDLVEDEEEHDEEDEHEDDDDVPALVLTLDMVPPVDPNFMSQLDESALDEMTTADLLQAFCANEAALLYNGAALQQEAQPPPRALEEVKEGDMDDDEDVVPRSRTAAPRVSLTLRTQAARLQEDLQATVLSSASAQTVLAETRTPLQVRQAAATQRRGQRTVRTGGRTTFLKQQIQRQFNVAWGDSLRYCILFVLFGHFGGRTPLARAILLLGAPSVFILQARVVKVALKRFLYTLLDHPPGILLSLLPAPQQVLLNLQPREAMELLYGAHALENRVVGTDLSSEEDEDALSEDDEEEDDLDEDDDWDEDEDDEEE
jgi:hypothetical protein